MQLKVEKFVRREFPVDKVTVTEDNLELVAEWCGGDVRTDRNGARYVKVRVVRPLTSRQSEAYVNDVVLYAGTGYKVYTPKAFEAAFKPASPETSSYPVDDNELSVAEQEAKV